MDSFTRYVLRQLFFGMILVTAGLTSVIWLSQSLRFVDWIVNRGLTIGMFMYLTMLLLPNFLTIILPIALFTIVLFTYSRMVSDRELVVMRAAGLSQGALAKPALILAAMVILIGYVLNIYLLPQSYRLFRDLQWDFRYGYSHVLLQEGAFNSVASGVTIYVRERSAEGELKGILVRVARDKEPPQTLMAERGLVIQADGVSRIVMFNGNRQQRDKGTGQLSILYFDKFSIDLDQKSQRDMARYREARERSMGELFRIDEDKGLNPNDVGKFVVEAHKRLVSPFAALGFTLIGLACLISGSVTRRAQTRRIVLAVLCVVGVQTATLGLENLCAKNTALLPLMYVNAVVPAATALVFMLQGPRRSRRSFDSDLKTA